MGLTEKVPDASTLSQNRIRRFNDSDVFQQVFDQVVEQALGRGMANGRVLYTDSTHLKANANPRKAVNEVRPEGVSEYLAELNAAVEADRKKHEKKPLPAVKKTPENAAAVKNTKVSTTDPESGFMHRDKIQCLLAATAQNIKKIALLALLYPVYTQNNWSCIKAARECIPMSLL